MKRTRPAALAAFVISIAVVLAALGGGWVLQRGGPPDGVMQAHAQNAPPPRQRRRRPRSPRWPASTRTRPTARPAPARA
jgi:hypothetical protein